MELNNYLEIILEGSSKPQFFADHLFREWKKAENKDYSIDEFIEGLHSANYFIKNKLEEQKRQEISLLYQFFAQEQEAGRQVENKKELIDEQNQIEYTFNPAHYGFNQYAGHFKDLNDVKFYNQKISEFSSKINKSIHTNKMNTEMNNKQEFDLPQHEADNIIEEMTIEYYVDYFEEIKKGNISLKELVEVEIRMNEIELEKSTQKGFGNEVRVYLNNINQLKEYMKLNNIVGVNINNSKENLRQIEPIDFKGVTKRDLPYIFWQLEKLGLIENKNLGLTLSKVFTYLNEPINNTYFNAEFSKFESGEMPKNAIELDKILLRPKKKLTTLK